MKTYPLLTLTLALTLLVACVAPGGAPTPATPTHSPVPPTPTTLSPTALRYSLLASQGVVSFCDPDQFPVTYADEPARAQAWFTETGIAAEEVQTILNAKGLNASDNLTAEQILLVYREHKMLQSITLEPKGADYAFQMHAATDEHVEGLVTATGQVSAVKRTPQLLNCPKCLAGETLIATPDGPRAINTLRPGMSVWTADASGERMATTILQVVRRPVPATHEMVRITLADGRTVRASPGHPTADGRTVGDLRPGDTLDGAQVTQVTRAPLQADATYDILPAGPTGTYWADGILLGSTLRP